MVYCKKDMFDVSIGAKSGIDAIMPRLYIFTDPICLSAADNVRKFLPDAVQCFEIILFLQIYSLTPFRRLQCWRLSYGAWLSSGRRLLLPHASGQARGLRLVFRG